MASETTRAYRALVAWRTGDWGTRAASPDETSTSPVEAVQVQIEAMVQRVSGGAEFASEGREALVLEALAPVWTLYQPTGPMPRHIFRVKGLALDPMGPLRAS